MQLKSSFGSTMQLPMWLMNILLLPSLWFQTHLIIAIILTFGKLCKLLTHTILNEESYRSFPPEGEVWETSLSSGSPDAEHTFSHGRAGPRAGPLLSPLFGSIYTAVSKQVPTRLGRLSDIVYLAWQTRMQGLIPSSQREQLFSSHFILDFSKFCPKVTFIRFFFVLLQRYRSKSHLPSKCYLLIFWTGWNTFAPKA